MKKYWEDMAVCESEDGFWEIINIEDRLELLFFPFEKPKDNKEANTHLTIKLSKNQLNDLLNFTQRMNKEVK